MKSITTEEKNLKRFLKKKVKVDLTTVVKVLICGIACFTITACGGGGGGSTPGTTITGTTGNKPGDTGKKNDYEVKQLVKENIYEPINIKKSNKTAVNEKHLVVNPMSPLGIAINRSKFENKGIISIDGEVGKKTLKQQSGVSEEIAQDFDHAAVYVKNGKIENAKGAKIEIKGNSVVGIAGLESSVINNGIIEGKNLKESTAIAVYTNNRPNVEMGEEPRQLRLFSAEREIGMRDDWYTSEELKSHYFVENNGKINLEGINVTGIYARADVIEVINKGHIKLEFKPSRENLPVYFGGGIILEGNMGRETSDNAIYNEGIIDIIGLDNSKIKENQDVDIAGLGIKDGGYILNEGTINVSGCAVGINLEKDGEVENVGIINVDGDGAIGIAVDKMGNESHIQVYNESEGKINVKNKGIGMLALNDIENPDPDTLGLNIENEGLINVTDGGKYGMYVSDYGRAKNIGTINIINSESSISDGAGMSGENGNLVNYSIINVDGKGLKGMEIKLGVGKNAVGTFNDEPVTGTITASNGAIGMVADGMGANAENWGNITVGKDSIGMIATGEDAEAENLGTIKVLKGGKYAMFANNKGKVINRGTIDIEGSHSESGTPEAVAFHAENGGIIKNYGKISVDGTVKINKGSRLDVVPNSSLSAKKISVNGTVTVNVEKTEKGYAKEYAAENVIQGDSIELGQDAQIKSGSVMYEAIPVVTNKTLGARVTRLTSTSLEGKINPRYVDGTLALEKAYSSDLSAGQQAVIDKMTAVDASHTLDEVVGNVTGREYLAVGRQVLDIKENFRKYDKDVIDSMDENRFNARVIGEYAKVDTRKSVADYKDNMVGFNASAELSDNLYGVAGYGYSDIDYKKGSSKEKIHTLHAGIYKDFARDNNRVRVGVFGDYNFHRMDRRGLVIDDKTNFHSYLAGVSGEYSKHFGDKFYAEPMVGLDITYGNIDRVAESDALRVSKQNYTSVLPKVGIEVGENFDMGAIYVRAQYSKDLGNVDKDIKMMILGQNAKVENERLKEGQVDISLGVKGEIENVTLSADIGRRFGRTHTTYMRAQAGYRF